METKRALFNSRNAVITKDLSYSAWLKELKAKVRTVQIKAAVKVNSELLQFYWELGQNIVDKQKKSQWGDGFLRQLSLDLSAEFPDMKGFSLSNIKYIKQWHLFYVQETEKSQQAVGQLLQIPWGHHIVIISKCESFKEALFYISKTIQNNWSRAVLTHHIEGDLYKREGKAITNFKSTLPAPE